MRVVSAAEMTRALAFPALIEALRDAFRAPPETPARHHHTLARPGAADATLLLMPAWTAAGAPAFAGVKIVSVFPDNPARGEPSVQGLYLLLDGETGRPLAALDGARLTLWRTAAASALAASCLVRPDASRLLMVGAGALAPFLVRAHASVRPLRDIAIWNRSPDGAERLAAQLAERGLPARPAASLEQEARAADLISCATLSSEPLILGEWLRPGAHLDLVGGFRPTMREADDEAVRRATLFCDTRAGACQEAGDLTQPLASGLIQEGDIAADLFDLCGSAHPGRRNADEITLFKSVGTALEDLAAAILVWRQVGDVSPP